MYAIFSLIIIIVLILFLIVAFNAKNIEAQLLVGFWRADQSFLDASGLQMLLVYIGQPHSELTNTWPNQYPGYILMSNSDGIIINDQVVFHVNEQGWTTMMHVSPKERKYNMRIQFASKENKGGYNFFPSKQILTFNPILGKVVFEDKNQVYAILYKDCSSSELCHMKK